MILLPFTLIGMYSIIRVFLLMIYFGISCFKVTEYYRPSNSLNNLDGDISKHSYYSF